MGERIIHPYRGWRYRGRNNRSIVIKSKEKKAEKKRLV